MKWLLPVAVVAVAVLAELTLGRAGGAPDFALFFGRFHPLVVHLPIGFFLLVAMGEAATFLPKLRARVEPALGLLIPVSAFAALGAFLMGQLLALEGGFPAGALGWHRRLTLLAVIGMAACWVLFERQRERAGQGRVAYQAVMAATLGVLSLGAHFGGTMTRGESYLSKYAPGPLKPLLGAPEEKKAPPAAEEKAAAPVSEPLVYQDVLQPVLKQYCVECHGPEKQKGKLRLDSLAELMKGGENGPALVAGAPKKSPLLARMLLPAADDDHMPPEGKPGPKPDALELMQFWIERGASPTLKVKDLLVPNASRALLEHALGGAVSSGAVPVATTEGATKSGDSTPKGDAAAPAGSAAPVSGSAAASSGSAIPPGKGGASEPASATPGSAAPPAPSAGVSSGPAFLATYCEKCHGAAKQKAKLRVDSVAALLQGGANGAALVPGSPDKSSIVQRVRLAVGNEDHMPPAKEPQPSAAEVAALVAWVRAGASGAAASKGSGSVGATSGSTAVAANGKSDASAGPSATAPAGAPGSFTSSAAVPGAPSAVEASAPAANVSGPADAAVLKDLPARVALFHDAVQPLLREKCGKCHIKDKPAAGLGVAEHAQLLEGGYSGPAIVPKDRKASLLMQRLVLPPSDEEHMPPEGEPVLAADDIELIGAWIDQGAPATGPTETARLTAGAARALAARGIHGAPEPAVAAATVPAQAGGCAACSVPGAPQSKWLGLQALALLAAASTLVARRAARLS